MHGRWPRSGSPEAKRTLSMSRWRPRVSCCTASTGPVTLPVAPAGRHSVSHGLALATTNRREFDRVPSLVVEDWAA